MSHKSRNLTIYDYLTVLQVEYIVADLRKKIATRAKDKSYYEKVLFHKKQKIEDICNRNMLHSIFSDIDEYEQVRKSIYVQWGFPKFVYKDDQEKIDIQSRDVFNYLSEKSEIRVLVKGESTKLGIIVSSKEVIERLEHFDYINEIAISVHIKGESEPQPILVKHISRIL